MKKNFTFLFFLSLLLIFLARPADISSSEKPPHILRVCVIDDKDRIYLVLKGAYKIYAVNSDRVLMEGPRLRANVKAAKAGLSIGANEIKVRDVKLKVYKDSNIFIDGRRFRGDVDIIRKDNSTLSVINNIELEDYLYGVLYHEVSHKWPMEVLKAQAIAARTFAVYQKRQNALQPYDLRSDIYSQVYGGRTSERWATTRAVNLTEGKVLAFNGEIFPAYYHATCAGYTEDASSLWNIDIAPLKGVKCVFCKNSPHYRWKKEVSLWRLQNKLKEKGYKIGRINSINILSTDKSGRAEKIEMKDGTGISIIMAAKEFRQMLGPNEIRSAKFDVSIKWEHAVFDGSGWGHGVGMCQWGAYGLAKKGKKAEEILKFYYPGADITALDKISNKI